MGLKNWTIPAFKHLFICLNVYTINTHTAKTERMEMRVVSILNQKGGVGKTTLATNIASCLYKDGHKVLLVDMDPQGSSSDWAEENDSDDALPVVRMGKNIGRDIRRIGADFDWIIVDGAPQVSELSASAIKASDLVLIPTTPSPYDCWSAGSLVELIKERQTITDGLPYSAFVISRAIKNTTLEKDVEVALTGYELPIFKSKTTQRVDYAKTASSGGSVLDLNEGHPARHEISMIVEEMIRCFQ